VNDNNDLETVMADLDVIVSFRPGMFPLWAILQEPRGGVPGRWRYGRWDIRGWDDMVYRDCVDSPSPEEFRKYEDEMERLRQIREL
jgi:hypothetical protein